MGKIKKARKVLGLVAVIILLVMVTADFFVEGLQLNQMTTYVLLSLITALLGLDVIGERVMSVKFKQQEGGD